MRHINPQELQAWLADPSRSPPLLLDVRENWEYELCHIEGSRLLPMSALQARVQEVERDREVVVICHHGVRSYHVARYLEQLGYDQVINLTGGVDACAKEADRTMPTY